ncbi:conjugative transposon protein TraM [Phocaeicola sartorii]|uniref:conjugative transposon protein TraM n=1 Tax=Phocaeicola sartorii TaxID=671267 RepID=UPI00266F943E|nr:conjugative transposon protein TraM [Phocaeicola sartorii]
MMITDKINFKQPKYVLPAILYPLLLISGYLIFDIFDTEPAETGNTLQTTEFLNPELPQARVDNNGGIDGKYESMVKSYGRIQDFSAVENIERNNNEDDKEAYESKYTEDDLALLDTEADRRMEELERLREMQERLRKSAEKGEAMNHDTVSLPSLDEHERIARSEQRRKEALAELDKALAEARSQGRKGLEPTPDNTDTSVYRPVTTGTVTDRNVEVNGNAVHELGDDAETGQVVKKIKTSSDYFHTLAENDPEPKLIKAIIDENIKAVDGSRVRLRLLDDVEINETVVPKGSYLYATMSGFGNQRVKGSVKSILVDDELVKVSLSLYDTDGLEGLYVPGSAFRETAQDVASNAMNSTMSINNGTSGNTFSQWGMQAIQNAYQRTSNALSKAVKKNKAKLKYGTFVYLVNGREKRK